jgi:hypothetical protein
MKSPLPLTIPQKQFLAVQALQEIGVNVTVLLLFSFFLGSYRLYLGIVAAIVTVAFYAPFTLQYCQDYFGPSSTMRGAFTKQKRQVRGPSHYYLAQGNLQIRVPKQLWRQIKPDQVYDIWYAPRTKWLLSYEVAGVPGDSAGTISASGTGDNSAGRSDAALP